MVLARYLTLRFPNLTLVLLLAAFSGCRHRSSDPVASPVILSKSENATHHLAICLYGPQSSEEWSQVSYLTLRNTRTQEEVQYKLGQDAIPGGKDFYLQASFSPDGELLVLPLGMGQGYGFLKTTSAMEDLKAGRFIETVTLQSTNGVRYQHTFRGWDEGNSIRFEAGPVHDKLAYRFNLESRQVTLIQSVNPVSWIAKTSNGFVPVLSSSNNSPR